MSTYVGLELDLARKAFVFSNHILNRIQPPQGSELIVGEGVVDLREPAFHRPVNTGRDFVSDDFYEVSCDRCACHDSSEA
jgi:hypothetical protein